MNKIILGEHCKESDCDCNMFAGQLDEKNFKIVSSLLPAHDGCDCEVEDEAHP